MNPTTAESVVKSQLAAYNARDVEAFAATYHPEAVVTDLASGRVVCSGRDEMRRVYGEMFAKAPGLRCEVRTRIVLGSRVIDEERVTGAPGGRELHAVAIYEVEAGLIRRVWLVREG